jgi:hypothetical protein
MRIKLLLVELSIMYLATFSMSCPAQKNPPAGNIVQGMNLVNPHRGSIEYQNQLIAQLRENNIHVVRCWIRPDPKDIDFAKRLYAAGIKIDVLLSPEYPPNTPVRPAPSTPMNNMWSLPKLADASPDLSKKSFESVLGQLDANGIQVVGFEFLNEINGAGFNGDFPAPGQGKTFDLQDLSSDPEAEQVAKGFLQYLKILAVLKDVRDRSRVNSHAPIILAGLAAVNGPGLHPNNKADAVSINATIQFMRQHGSDDLVDVYGVHIYPKAASPSAMKLDIETNEVAECGKPKPCWITEWGFDNDDLSCPVNDDARAALVQSVMDDYEELVKQGKVTGELYFSWDTDPSSKEPRMRTIYRCGQLLKSGREALEPLSR